MSAAPSFDRMAFHRALQGLGMRMRQPLHIHALVDSTSSEARRLAARGAPSGTLVVADAQTAGRGRGSNRWISPPGRGLYMSILLRGGGEPGAAPDTALSLLLGAAAAEAVTRACGGKLRAGVKWPNDVMAGGKKLGGLLLEAVSGVGPEDSFAIAGMGINLRHDSGELQGTDQPATSLALELGMDSIPSREDVLAHVCASWERALGAYAERGFAELERLWEEHGVHERGEWLTLDEAGQAAEGGYEGIAGDGALLLRTASGATRRFVVGQARRLRRAENASRAGEKMQA